MNNIIYTHESLTARKGLNWGIKEVIKIDRGFTKKSLYEVIVHFRSYKLANRFSKLVSNTPVFIDNGYYSVLMVVSTFDVSKQKVTSKKLPYFNSGLMNYPRAIKITSKSNVKEYSMVTRNFYHFPIRALNLPAVPREPILMPRHSKKVEIKEVTTPMTKEETQVIMDKLVTAKPAQSIEDFKLEILDPTQTTEKATKAPKVPQKLEPESKAVGYSRWYWEEVPDSHKDFLPIFVKKEEGVTPPKEKSVMVNSMVLSAINSHSVVGFSGATNLKPEAESIAWAIAQQTATNLLPTGRSIVTGCADGLDKIVRTVISNHGWEISYREEYDYAKDGALNVFDVNNYLVDGKVVKSSFARRSIDCVQAVAGYEGSQLWVSFPSNDCPKELMESTTSNPFNGYGSGTWASLALAVNKGIDCLVYLPRGCQLPNWGFKSLGEGWFFMEGQKTIKK
jgi:hypothetical protein